MSINREKLSPAEIIALAQVDMIVACNEDPRIMHGLSENRVAEDLALMRPKLIKVLSEKHREAEVDEENRKKPLTITIRVTGGYEINRVRITNYFNRTAGRCYYAMGKCDPESMEQGFLNRLKNVVRRLKKD